MKNKIKNTSKRLSPNNKPQSSRGNEWLSESSNSKRKKKQSECKKSTANFKNDSNKMQMNSERSTKTSKPYESHTKETFKWSKGKTNSNSSTKVLFNSKIRISTFR